MNVKQILENYLQYLNFSFYIQLTSELLEYVKELC